MHSRWFNAAVVLLWLTTMGWLVKAKVLPPLIKGEPPSYRRIVASRLNEPPIGWNILVNDRQLGWALTEVGPSPIGLTEIRGRAHLDKLPLKHLTPNWLKPLTNFLELSAGDESKLQLDVRSLITIDPLGRLSQFESTVWLLPWRERLRVRGNVEGGKMEIILSAGGLTFNHEFPLPANALLSDALSPQTELPGLHQGQSWSVPIYSPLWPNQPLEIIRATVEDKEPIFWDDDVHEAWLVVYRSDGATSGESQKPKGRLWVRPDGAVLKQQVAFFDLAVTFERLDKEKTDLLLHTIGEKWWQPNDEPVDQQ